MLKKIKELLGFPTEQEKAAAKVETPVDTAVTAAKNVFAFPTSDKPEAQAEAKPKVKRTPKPKAETAAKAPAKKPAAKKPTAKKPAAKKTTQTKAV